MTKLLVILLQQQRSIQYESILKIVIPENWAEKPLILLFSAFLWETWLMSYMWNSHGLHTTNLHSDSSYLNIFFKLPTLSTFSKYSHIQKYRTQDCGAGGRPIGSLTTIHTNIPTITITVLAMELWNVIKLLYVYACISLSGYMTKLLVILLQQLRSI